MNNLKNYNKSAFLDIPQFSKRNIVRRHSYNVAKDNLKDVETFKNKLKKVDKDMFKNIPKNDNLDFSSIIHNDNNDNKNNQKNIKDNKHILNLLNNIYINDEHLDNTNIKQRLNDNVRISSLIPISKKKRNSKSKQKTTEENNNLIFNILKKETKKHSKSKVNFICNEDKLSKNSKLTKNSKNVRKFNSSMSLIKVSKFKNSNINKKNEIDSVKLILKDKIKPKKDPKKEEKKNEEKPIEKRPSKNIISESNIIKESLDKEKGNININNVKTKNEYELLKSKKKEKEKKYKKFPLCCISIKDDDSSDFD